MFLSLNLYLYDFFQSFCLLGINFFNIRLQFLKLLSLFCQNSTMLLDVHINLLLIIHTLLIHLLRHLKLILLDLLCNFIFFFTLIIIFLFHLMFFLLLSFTENQIFVEFLMEKSRDFSVK